MLSSATKYTIRAVLYLATYTDISNKIGVKQIAEDLEIPQPFLAKFLQQLSRSKLVSSSKGPSGGFYLSEHNQQNSVWDIIKAIDGTEKFDQCFMGLSTCNDKNPCPVHFIVGPFKEKILYDFKDKSIHEFTGEIKLSGKYLSLRDFDV